MPKNDTPDKALVEATQVDRDAAAALIRQIDHRTEYLAEIEDGSYDENYFVQAFARHRLAALSQPQHGGLVEAIEQAIAWHEEHDEAISKQENALDPHNVWRRLHHQEQRDMLRAALANSPVVGEDAPAINHKERVEYEERILALEMDIERLKKGERPIYAGLTAAEIGMGTYHPGDEA